MEQKHQLIKRLVAITQQHLEEQADIWENEGYDRRELYHMMHREFTRLYGKQVRDYEVNELDNQSGKGGIS